MPDNGESPKKRIIERSGGSASSPEAAIKTLPLKEKTPLPPDHLQIVKGALAVFLTAAEKPGEKVEPGSIPTENIPQLAEELVTKFPEFFSVGDTTFLRTIETIRNMWSNEQVFMGNVIPEDALNEMKNPHEMIAYFDSYSNYFRVLEELVAERTGGAKVMTQITETQKNKAFQIYCCRLAAAIVNFIVGRTFISGDIRMAKEGSLRDAMARILPSMPNSTSSF